MPQDLERLRQLAFGAAQLTQPLPSPASQPVEQPSTPPLSRLRDLAFGPEVDEPSKQTQLSFADRFILSFAGSQEDTVRLLQNKFGADNAINTAKGIAFRRSPEERFRFIDESGFSLGDIADLFGESLPALGGTIGGIAGTVAGPLGAVGGATLGGAAGESFRQLGARMVGAEVPESSLEAATNIGISGVSEGTLEAGGGLAARGLSRLVGIGAGRVTPQAQRVINYLKDAGLEDVSPSLAQATSSPIIDIAENFAEGGFLGGSLLTFKESTKGAVNRLSRGVAKQFAETIDPESSILALKNVLDETIRLDRTAASGIRQGIVKKVGRTVLVPGEKFNQIRSLIGERNFDNILAKRGITPRGSLGGAIELGDALTVRTEILALTRKTQRQAAQAETLLDLADAKRAVGVIDDAVKKKLSPELLKEFNLSNQQFKRMYQKEAIRDLVVSTANSSSAPAILDQLALDEIVKIKKLLGADDPAFQVLQMASVGSAIDRALNKAQTDVLGTTLRERILGKGEIIGAFTPEKVRTLLGKKGEIELGRILEALDVLQAGAETGTGSVAVKLIQVGAAGTLIAGGLTGVLEGDTATQGAAGIILGPWAFARLISYGPTRKLMLQGLSAQAKGNTRVALSSATRLAQWDRILQDSLGKYINQELEGS